MRFTRDVGFAPNLTSLFTIIILSSATQNNAIERRLTLNVTEKAFRAKTDVTNAAKIDAFINRYGSSVAPL